MIHAVCDFCGKDCDLNAYFITVQPFSNYAKYHDSTEPYNSGNLGVKQGYVMCQKCFSKSNLPNPFKMNPKIEDLNYSFCEYKSPEEVCQEEMNKLDGILERISNGTGEEDV